MTRPTDEEWDVDPADWEYAPPLADLVFAFAIRNLAIRKREIERTQSALARAQLAAVKAYEECESAVRILEEAVRNVERARRAKSEAA